MERIECVACGKTELFPLPVPHHICQICYLRKEEHGEN